MRRASVDVWRQFLEDRGVDPNLAKTWASYARPSIRLVPSGLLDKDTTAPRASKFGGAPDLPIGVSWPERSPYNYRRMENEFRPPSAWERRPLTFLAQINLADVARVGCDLPLPQLGLLLFFYDSDVQPWGFDPLDAPGSQIFYVGAETPVRRQNSPSLEISRAKSIRCEAAEGLPGSEWLAGRLRGKAGYDTEAFNAALEKLTDDDWHLMGEGSHAFGGWADEIQAPMELGCEMVANGLYCGDGKAYADPRMPLFQERSSDWHLLLQLDTDDELSWPWGDGGKLYFWCREADISAGRFEKAWPILQCY